MQRITITIDDDLLTVVDALMEKRGYTSRSEAIRDIVRDSRAQDKTPEPSQDCVATLTYVYDHGVRDLARRVTQAHHDHHDLAVASMRVHLDHHSLMESSVLRGKSDKIATFADSLASQRGIRYTNLHTIPVTIERIHHHHGGDASQHDHLHV